MADFCSKCGKEIPEGKTVCAECEAKASEIFAAEESAAVAPSVPAEIPAPEPQPTQSYETVPKGGKYGVVGMGAFLGLSFVCAIPVIGLIVSIILAFAPKNRNIRNYARAMIVWGVIGLVIVGILAVGVYLAVQAVNQMLVEFNDQYGGLISQFGELSDILKQFGDGDLAGLIDQFQNGEYGEIIDQFQSGEYGEILDQLQDSEYGEILDQLTDDEYNALRDQIQNGEYSDLNDLLDQIQNATTDGPAGVTE